MRVSECGTSTFRCEGSSSFHFVCELVELVSELLPLFGCEGSPSFPLVREFVRALLTFFPSKAALDFTVFVRYCVRSLHLLAAKAALNFTL